MSDKSAPTVEQQRLVRLARFYGIDPFVKWEDVWPFGDPHDVGKFKADLEDQIIAAELKRRGIDPEPSFKAIHEWLDARIAEVNVRVVAPPPLESDCAETGKLPGGCSPTTC